jgi:glycosyltransferase involved in cell wall biosynthesis
MLPLSIVILTKNEAQNIARCLQPLFGLTDDILIVDNGSTDNTIEIAQSMQANILQTTWKGYSRTKNEGNAQAKYDWILSLDADEVIHEDLKNEIIQLFSTELKETESFAIQRKMMYCGQQLNYGAVANEFRLRIFNRKNGLWNEEAVHENLFFKEKTQIKKLTGFVYHFSYNTTQEHVQRLEKYAQLFASKSTKKATIIKIFLSPIFGFLRNYFFKLGFLDGKLGFQFAKNELWYTFRKYQLLNLK